MSEKVATFAELMSPSVNNVQYDTVKVHGTMIRIGSCSSEDIITWTEENDNPALRRLAGLRLAVKCVVDETGARVPEDLREGLVKSLSQKDARQNGLLVQACLKLNGLDSAARQALKNDLPEAPTAASPSGLQGTSNA